MISSRAVGQELPPIAEEITVRRVLAYAAGIGDTAPAVFDDLGAIMAPPAFCVALEWPVVSQPAVGRLLGARSEELRRGVHALQDSRFHRPIRPGMRVVTRAIATGLRTTRAGTLATLRLETADDAGPVVTSWMQSLYRDVALDGPELEIEPPPGVPDVAADGEPERTSIAIPAEMPHVYTECARIWNPIHTERRVALAAGLPDVILHGTATWALAGREIVARHADGDPTRLRRLRGRFRAMVLPGSRIELCHRATAVADGGARIAFSVRNASGDEAIAEGFAEIGA